MTQDQQLKHRLLMIEDDLKEIIKFIKEENLHEIFEKSTRHSDNCWTHFTNIKIACDLTSEESLSWELFKLTKI